MLLLKNSKFQTIIENVPSNGTEKTVDLSTALRGSNNGAYIANSHTASTIAGISVRIIDYKHVSRQSGGVLRIVGPSSSSILIPISPSSPDYSSVSSDADNELLYLESSDILRIVSGDFRLRLAFDPWSHSSSGAFGKHLFSRGGSQPVVIPRVTPGNPDIDLLNWFDANVPSNPTNDIEEEELNRIYFTGSNTLGFITNVLVTIAGSDFDNMVTRAAAEYSPILLFEPTPQISETMKSSITGPGGATKLGKDSIYTKSSAKIWVSPRGNTSPLTSSRCSINWYGIIRAIYPVLPGIPLGSSTDPMLQYRSSSAWGDITRNNSNGGAAYLPDIPTVLSSLVVEAKILFNADESNY